MDIRLSGKFSVCGGGRGVDRIQVRICCSTQNTERVFAAALRLQARYLLLHCEHTGRVFAAALRTQAGYLLLH